MGIIHPFHRGYRARLFGRSEYDNPYPYGSGDRAAWQHGWDTAAEDSEEDAS